MGRGTAAYQITSRKATNEMPYYVAFKFETVISLEISLPIIWTKAYNVSHNEEILA